MAIYKDGSFDVHSYKNRNGQVVDVLGLDFVAEFEEFAKKKGISDRADAWGAKHNQLMNEFALANPQACKDYAFEQANYYNSEEVAEETDEGTIAEDEIEIGRIRDEINELDERLHSDQPDETEKESIRNRLIELRLLLLEREGGY